MSQRQGEDQVREYSLKDYVEIVGTNDEFEGLIGVVEDFYDNDGHSCQKNVEDSVCVVRIPIRKRDQELLRLGGVNFITPYVRQELQKNEELYIFEKKNLEWFDPNDL